MTLLIETILYLNLRDHSIVMLVERHLITQHVVRVTHDLDLDDLIKSMCAKCIYWPLTFSATPSPEINK